MMEPLPHYFDVFQPDTGETKARCATRLEADYAAIDYAKREGRRFYVYECQLVSETHPSPPLGED